MTYEEKIIAEWERYRAPVNIPKADESINASTIENCLLLGGWVIELEIAGKPNWIFHYERDYQTYHIPANIMLSSILTQQIYYDNQAFQSVKHDIITDAIYNTKINFKRYNERLSKGNANVSINKIHYMEKNKTYVQAASDI